MNIQPCRFVAVALLALGLASTAHAAILAWDFTGNNGTADPVNATTVASGLETTAITRSGVTASAVANTFSATGWEPSFSGPNTSRYFEFVITPLSGYQFTLSSIDLNLQTPNSYDNINWALRSSLDSYGANLDSWGNGGSAAYGHTVTLDNTFENQSASVTFRLYGFYDSTSSSGGLAGAGLSLNGSVVPEPTTYALAAFGLLFLGSLVLRHLRCAKA